METWKPVPGYEGRYEVSDQGRVWSVRLYKMLRPGPSNYGHLSVSLGWPQRTHMVHILVLTAFVGPRPKGMECRHLDGDPKNNKVENLKWGTRRENILEAVWHGTWFSEKRIKHNKKLAEIGRQNFFKINAKRRK